jgi:hypothetical protein
MLAAIERKRMKSRRRCRLFGDLTRYGWNFSVIYYGIIQSNPSLPSQSADKSGVMAELCRIVPHLGSGIQRAGIIPIRNLKRF